MLQLIDSTFPLNIMLEFCKQSIGDKRPNAVNMDPIDWGTKPNTLLYLLYKEKRFDGPKSGYLIYINTNKIVAGMGFYPSDWDKNIFVQSRAYTVPGHLKGLGVKNATLTNDLTWFMEDVTINAGYKGGCVSFEEYNKKLLDACIRINNPNKYSNYKKVLVDGIVKEEYRDTGKRMREQKYAGVFKIKNILQHVMYYLYTPTYEEEFLEKLNTCQN